MIKIENDKPWCYYQLKCVEDEAWLCIAHLAEGRAFPCPFSNLHERNKHPYPCSDYKKPRDYFARNHQKVEHGNATGGCVRP